jgi:hypothetical protein
MASSTPYLAASAPPKPYEESQQQQQVATPVSKREKPTHWDTPLSQSEVKGFFDSYMPWAGQTAFAMRKQQIITV